MVSYNVNSIYLTLMANKNLIDIGSKGRNLKFGGEGRWILRCGVVELELLLIWAMAKAST